MSELEIKFKEWLKSSEGSGCVEFTAKEEILRMAFYAGSVAHKEMAQELGEKFLNAQNSSCESGD